MQLFRWQSRTTLLSTYTDSDWAGDKVSRKSTSGGIAFLGVHCIKSWLSNQAIVALSSAKAELYSLLKGASQTLGLKSTAVSRLKARSLEVVLRLHHSGIQLFELDSWASLFVLLR